MNYYETGRVVTIQVLWKRNFWRLKEAMMKGMQYLICRMERQYGLWGAIFLRSLFGS